MLQLVKNIVTSKDTEYNAISRMDTNRRSIMKTSTLVILFAYLWKRETYTSLERHEAEGE